MSDLFEIRDDEAGDDGCLSELELDRLLGDEDTGGELRARVDACEHCQERLAALMREREQHLADRPPHLAASLIAAAAEERMRGEKPGFWRRVRDWRIVAPLTAALTAAVILLVLSTRQGGVADDRDVVRLKGGERFSVLTRGPGGDFRRVADGEALAAGSELGFQAFCTERCRLSLVGISEMGDAYVVDRDRALPAAQEHSPDFTVDLDASPGGERFYAVFCAGELDTDALVKELEQLYPADAGGRRNILEARELAHEHCTARTRLVKRIK